MREFRIQQLMNIMRKFISFLDSKSFTLICKYFKIFRQLSCFFQVHYCLITILNYQTLLHLLMTHILYKNNLIDQKNFITPVKNVINNEKLSNAQTKKKIMQQDTELHYQTTIKKLEDKIQMLEDQAQKSKHQWEKKVQSLSKEKNVLQLTIVKLSEKENPKQNICKSPKVKLNNNQLIGIDNMIQMENLQRSLTQLNKQVGEKNQQISSLRRDMSQLMKMMNQQISQLDKLKLENANLHKTVNYLNLQMIKLRQNSAPTPINREKSHSSHKQSSQMKRKNEYHKNQSKADIKKLELELRCLKNKAQILSETIELMNQQLMKKNLSELNRRYRNTY